MALLCSLLRDDAALLGVRPLQLGPMTLDRRLERRNLLDDARILLGGRIDRLDPVQQILEARRAEEHRERRVVLGRGVRGHEPGGERVLRNLEVRLRELELPPILSLIGLDLVEADIGEVVGLDGGAQAVVDLLDLGEHPLSLRPLRGDRARVCVGHRRRKQQPGYAEDECLGLSSPAANQ